jgi:hypothetical protein
MVVRQREVRGKHPTPNQSEPRPALGKFAVKKDHLPGEGHEWNPYAPPTVECAILKEKPDEKKLKRAIKLLRSKNPSVREETADKLIGIFQQFKDEYGYFASRAVNALLESRCPEGEKKVLEIGVSEYQIKSWRDFYKSRMRKALIRGVAKGLLAVGVWGYLVFEYDAKNPSQELPPANIAAIVLCSVGYSVYWGISTSRVAERANMTGYTRDMLGV